LQAENQPQSLLLMTGIDRFDLDSISHAPVIRSPSFDGRSSAGGLLMPRRLSPMHMLEDHANS